MHDNNAVPSPSTSTPQTPSPRRSTLSPLQLHHSSSNGRLPAFTLAHPIPRSSRQSLAAAFTKLIDCGKEWDEMKNQMKLDELVKEQAAEQEHEEFDPATMAISLLRPSMSNAPNTSPDSDAGDNPLAETTSHTPLPPSALVNLRRKTELRAVDLLHCLRRAISTNTNPFFANARIGSEHFRAAEDPLLRRHQFVQIVETCVKLKLSQVVAWMWHEYASLMIDRSEQHLNRLVDAWIQYQQHQQNKNAKRTKSFSLPRYFQKPPEYFPMFRPNTAMDLIRCMARSNDLDGIAEVLQYMGRCSTAIAEAKQTVQHQLPHQRLPSFLSVCEDWCDERESVNAYAVEAAAKCKGNPAARRTITQLLQAAAMQPVENFDELSASSAEMAEIAAERALVASLSSHAHTGDWQSAVAVLEQLPYPRSRDVSLALQACRTAGTLDAAQAGVDLLSAIDAHRASAAANVHHDPTAYERWLNYDPTITLYNDVFELYKCLGDINASMRLFDQLASGSIMSLQGNAIRPDLATFNNLIRICTRGIEIVRKIDQKELRAALTPEEDGEDGGCVEYVDEIDENGLMERQARPRTPLPSSSTALAYKPEQLLAMAESFFQMLQDEPYNLTPTATTYMELMLAHLRTRRSCGLEVNDLFQHMQQAGIKPTPMTYMVQLRAYAQSRDIKAMLNWHMDMAHKHKHEVGISIYSVKHVLKALAMELARRSYAAAFAAMTQQWTFGANQPSTASIIGIDHLLHTAVSHFTLLSEFGIRPTSDAVHELMRCFANVGRGEETLRLLQAMKGAANESTNWRYTPSGSNAFVNPALLNSVTSMPASVEHFITTLRAFSAAADYDRGMDVWNEMMRRHGEHQPPPHAHTTHLVLLLRCCRPMEEVESAYAAMCASASSSARPLRTPVLIHILRTVATPAVLDPSRLPTLYFLYDSLCSDFDSSMRSLPAFVFEELWMMCSSSSHMGAHHEFTLEMERQFKLRQTKGDFSER